MKSVVVGQSNTYEEALADVKSAIKFYMEFFGEKNFLKENIMETFVAEAAV